GARGRGGRGGGGRGGRSACGGAPGSPPPLLRRQCLPVPPAPAGDRFRGDAPAQAQRAPRWRRLSSLFDDYRNVEARVKQYFHFRRIVFAASPPAWTRPAVRTKGTRPATLIQGQRMADEIKNCLPPDRNP